MSINLRTANCQPQIKQFYFQKKKKNLFTNSPGKQLLPNILPYQAAMHVVQLLDCKIPLFSGDRQRITSMGEWLLSVGLGQ